MSSIHQPLAYGLGCALGIFSCAAVCGGHINPAVTVGHAFLGKLGPTFKANFVTSLWIIISQFLGGFVASGLVHTLYADAESSVSKSSVIKFSSKPSNIIQIYLKVKLLHLLLAIFLRRASEKLEDVGTGNPDWNSFLLVDIFSKSSSA